MMREILFRGKRIYNGEWVEGDFLRASYFFDGKERHYIFTDTEEYPGNEFIGYTKVAPETLGQFTGITDEHDKEIFEGDIVEAVLTDGIHRGFSWGRHLVVFEQGAFCLKDRQGQATPMCNYSVNVKFKVLGNIHDNPELLEVSE